MADNKIDSIKISVSGENILETKFDLNKSSEPTIQNIEIKETTESSTLDTTNLSVEMLTAQEIETNQSTIKTLEIETTTTNTLKTNKLVGDSLRVKNLFSSETQNQVYTSNGDTTKNGEWKTLSVGSISSDYVYANAYSTSITDLLPFHINLTQSQFNGGTIGAATLGAVSGSSQSSWCYLSFIFGTTIIEDKNDDTFATQNTPIQAYQTFLINDTIGESEGEVYWGTYGGLIQINTNSNAPYSWVGLILTAQEIGSNQWNHTISITPLSLGVSSFITIPSDIGFNFS